MKKINNNVRSEKLDALIFIDTNIFLDFYRLSNNVIDFLKIISENKDRIIFSTQVLMEFKKNRQSIILKTISELPNDVSLNVNYPPIIRSEDSEDIKKLVKKIKEIHSQQVKKFENIYVDPDRYDDVHNAIEKLSQDNLPYFLSDNHPKNEEIFNLAQKRFLRGFPPRKKDDTSLGDAINWEWIINCAKISGKDVIIVFRDGDFGKKIYNKAYINDWLLYEFKEMTARNIILTSELSTAFDMIKIDGVNKEMREAEQIIDQISFVESNIKELQQRIHKNYYNMNQLHSELQLSNYKKNNVGQIDLFASFEELDNI